MKERKKKGQCRDRKYERQRGDAGETVFNYLPTYEGEGRARLLRPFLPPRTNPWPPTASLFPAFLPPLLLPAPCVTRRVRLSPSYIQNIPFSFSRPPRVSFSFSPSVARKQIHRGLVRQPPPPPFPTVVLARTAL